MVNSLLVHDNAIFVVVKQRKETSVNLLRFNQTVHNKMQLLMLNDIWS